MTKVVLMNFTETHTQTKKKSGSSILHCNNDKQIKNLEIMKTINTIQGVREDNAKAAGFLNGRQAVIVTLPISARQFQYGVQFWTELQIVQKQVINSDNSISKFVEVL